VRPDDALADWHRWSKKLTAPPVIAGQLGGGRSNRSFLLESGLGRLVLRLNGSDSLLPARQRSFETRAWQLASNGGIAPPLLFTDEENRYIVSHHIDGILPAGENSSGELALSAIDLLTRCHQLDGEGPVMDYRAHIESYWLLIKARELKVGPALLDQRREITECLDELDSIQSGTVICHHDPIPANFVGTSKRLYLVDWEYAARGWPVMDFAAFAVEWSIDHTSISRRTGILEKNLAQAAAVYRHLCALWNVLAAPV
jgi:thiamine kinase-like enzyme